MFGTLFDLNRDGKTDAFEFGIALSIMEEDEIEEAEDTLEQI